MTIPCTVIDAGARYGLHPTWAELRGVCDFHLFEMDAAETERLREKYFGVPGISVYATALHSSDTMLNFRVRAHRALNSVFQHDDDLLRRNDYMEREFAPAGSQAVEARSIDSMFGLDDVHFLKLDVEGAELDVLIGAARKLNTTILGVRSEVCFAPVYKGAPLFGEIHQFMLDHGFELLGLDSASHKATRFTMPDRYGKLMSADAVWVVGNDRLFSATGDRLRDDVVRFALFCMNNGATDLAVDTLLHAVRREGVSFGALADDALFRALHRKVAHLFKSLLTLPQLGEADITGAYRTVFGREFPTMHRFYESDLVA